MFVPGISGHMPFVSNEEEPDDPGVGSFLFDGSNDYIELASAPVTAAPLTICAWMKSANDNTRAIGGVFNNTSTSNFQIIKIDNPQQDVGAQTWNGGSSGSANGGTFPLSTWCHVAGVFTSASSRACYLDGTQVNTNATSVTPSGINTTIIGANNFAGSRGAFFNGQIAHFAIWNVALSGSDITALAGGAIPSSIQSGNLMFYAKLTDGATVDSISGNSLTVSGAVYNADGPTIT